MFSGEVSEWSKEHDSKSCERRRSVGSTPTLSEITILVSIHEV